MSPARSQTINLLSVGSAVFGGMAIVCSMLFLVSPKGDIAVFMAYSLLGCIGTSTISLTLGILGLIFSRGKSKLAYSGLFISVMALSCPLLYFGINSVW